MSLTTLDDLNAVHRELAAMSAAGVQLDLGLHRYAASTPAALERATAQIALQMARGASLEEALDSPQAHLPPSYRGTLQAALRSGSLPRTLAGGRQRAAAVGELRQIVRGAVFYPLLVLVLAVVGIWVQGQSYLPTVEQTYEQLREPPGPAYDLAARVAAVLPPAMIVLGGVVAVGLWVWRRRGESLRWIPGVGRYLGTVEQAHLAYQLALLCAAEVPLSAALPTARRMATSGRLAAACAALAQEPPGAGVGAQLRRAGVRPLLAWALTSGLPPRGMASAMQLVHDAYQQSIRRQAFWLRIGVPAVACLVVGGSAVLAMSLMLFVPWVELLSALNF